MKSKIKALSLFFAGVVIGAIGFACGSGIKISIWYLDPTRGLVHQQTGQVMTWTQAKGYYCISPADETTLLAAYEACENAGK